MEGGPFLWSSMVLGVCQLGGVYERDMHAWYSSFSNFVSWAGACFRQSVGMLSGPGDLWGLNLFIAFSTSSIVRGALWVACMLVVDLARDSRVFFWA
jgi:hypothetical protein